uniref:Protein-S-isoprenylcysteine O-methyltransferase n=1 Tax=Corethron hystrix TaxID=216773 RepID=A0A7S1B5M3_9STRA|mmetsp:Transcript_1356/g.2757  ORF Transcript_1356/g.2757 Transcript_1356/m.2757 type:complete len:216 (+) Transcript_1356:203-850(+)
MSHSHGESSASPNQLKRYDNKLGVVHLPKFLFLRDAVDSVQDTLNFSWAVKDRGWEQFNDSTKPGRVALLSSILSLLLGLHTPFLFSAHPTIVQWSWYMVSLSTFHLLEFFVTAVFHPLRTDPPVGGNAFLVNHSRTYTIAFFIAVAEFWMRKFVSAAFYQVSFHSWRISWFLGICLVVGGQFVRSLAMATAGSNFHHIVQVQRPDEHQLVTHGM